MTMRAHTVYQQFECISSWTNNFSDRAQLTKTLETNFERVTYAFLAGAFTGSIIFPTAPFIPVFFEPNGIRKILTVFYFGFIFWFFGLLLIGSPIWALLHRLNKRKFYHAALAGFIPPFLVVLQPFTLLSPAKSRGSIFFNIDPTGKFWEGDVITWRHLVSVLESSAILGLVGALVAFAIWRTAYRLENKIEPIIDKNNVPLESYYWL